MISIVFAPKGGSTRGKVRGPHQPAVDVRHSRRGPPLDPLIIKASPGKRMGQAVRIGGVGPAGRSILGRLRMAGKTGQTRPAPDDLWDLSPEGLVGTNGGV